MVLSDPRTIVARNWKGTITFRKRKRTACVSRGMKRGEEIYLGRDWWLVRSTLSRWNVGILYCNVHWATRAIYFRMIGLSSSFDDMIYYGSAEEARLSMGHTQFQYRVECSVSFVVIPLAFFTFQYSNFFFFFFKRFLINDISLLGWGSRSEINWRNGT